MTRSFLPRSACSHAAQNISSLSGVAHVRYTRPALVMRLLGSGLPFRVCVRPGIGLSPNSPLSHLSLRNITMSPAYFAGLFDGEGYVRVARWEKPSSTHIRYQITAGIGMTFKPVIDLLLQEFGGSIHINRHDLRNKNARPQHCWIVASQKASAFFKVIKPFLIVKRDEVELALELQGNIDKYRHKFKNHRNTPDQLEVRAYREKLASEILALKKRQFMPPS